MGHYASYMGFICFLGLSACDAGVKDADHAATYTTKQLREPLIKTNKYLIRTEKDDIDDFVRRYKWQMRQSGTGLLYSLDEKNSTKCAVYGDIVKLNYTVKLLNGEIVYDSQKDGAMIFQVGKGGVPAGIEEGILSIGLHDKAKFILPSHLAYGLLGDSKRIPPHSILIYEIEIIEIQ